jgi:hypothetical protein
MEKCPEQKIDNLQSGNQKLSNHKNYFYAKELSAHCMAQHSAQ